MALVGANVGVAKLLAESLPIELIVFLRCVIAVSVLWPLARMMDGARIGVPRDVAWNLFWQAVVGTALYNAALLAGLRLTTALEGGLVLATLPAMVAVGGAWWLRETLPPRQWVAVALAACGMAALTAARLGGEHGGSLAGNALVLAAVLGEAAYMLLAKRIAGRVPVVTAGLWMQGLSALLLLPFAASSFGAITALAEPRLLVLQLFHAVSAGVVALLLWYAGLKRVPAGTAGVFAAFLPASAALVAVVLLGERFGLTHAAGFVLMLGSVLLATWPARKGAG